MKTIILMLAAFVAIYSIADTNSVMKVSPQKKGEIYMRKFGGFIKDPKSGTGHIGIVNAQSLLSQSEISTVVSNIHKNMKYNLVIRDRSEHKGLPTKEEVIKLGFDVAVFVIDDKSLPVLLAAPDDRWALVNVRKIKNGTKDDILGKRLFSIRSRGEIMRAFALACGIGTSSYPGNLYGVTSVEELDTTNVDATIMDMVQRCGAWLSKIGVTPERQVMYLRACREGWAPAPTNEYQKAIWDKIHAMPTAPIKIKPETKKVWE